MADDTAALAAEITAKHGTGKPAAPPEDAYFDRNGLRALDLAQGVFSMGPLAVGHDDELWAYEAGVWRPRPKVARARSTALLGQRFRNTHAANAESIVRANVPEISCDAVPEYVNFRNTLYRWKDDETCDHTPAVMSTVQMHTVWDPAAVCPEFDKFLTEVLPPDALDMVWELIGYLMFSGNPLHKAVMLTGAGRNGKGTLLRVMKALLGEENVTAVALADMTTDKFTTARLFGKTANIAGDIDATYLESTAKFKAITGNDLVSGEYKFGQKFDFVPWAVPMFSANKIPGSADVTTGYLSRWIVLHFPNSFLGREDDGLTGRLTTSAELSGIAAKAMPALRTLMERGNFELPESAKEALADFTRKVDQVRTWIDDCAELGPAFPHLNRTWLYECYKRWVHRDGGGVHPLKAHEFFDRLKAAGAIPAKVMGVRGFYGIRVADPVEGGWRP
ncbi:phage/plasmid primase, P4 family [Streptomyces sp. NBC_00879]|uniref:DNA primase family protein n=1 Tax=Streptomyces sp. NBC_00879 TaxID=2975855 RepID=UPI00386D3BAA|nr:phage/plasmid primase, P4 family [Streptomyces sp. NBC_00879]